MTSYSLQAEKRLFTYPKFAPKFDKVTLELSDDIIK